MHTIAIVEDEPSLRENYADALRRQGFSVRAHAERASAQATLLDQRPDLAIIDIGLGNEPEGGFELCRILRDAYPRLPIIFLTARDNEIDAVSGLRLGADDYLAKSISLPHLLARVQALLRRTAALKSDSSNDTLQRGDLLLDSDRLQATWQGQPVELTVTEFYLLRALARRPGHVKSRQQLMDAADLVVDPATITSHVKRLRRKLEVLDSNFDAIEAVYGAGYRWRAT